MNRERAQATALFAVGFMFLALAWRSQLKGLAA